ncbi:conjugal transfer protein TraW, partial [Klebsiella pneumoniae]
INSFIFITVSTQIIPAPSGERLNIETFPPVPHP